MCSMQNCGMFTFSNGQIKEESKFVAILCSRKLEINLIIEAESYDLIAWEKFSNFPDYYL